MAENTGFIDSSTPKLNAEVEKFVQRNPGPYIGLVTNNRDPLKMGRLSVQIASRSGTEQGFQSLDVTCKYMSPFWGTKTSAYMSKDNANSYEGSQHSYGMWMVPPDIGTRVMVIFVEGDANQAYWMGCIPEPLINQMTPGIGASPNTGVATSGGDFDQNKQQLYGTDLLPAGEVNKRILADSSGSIKQPIHPQAELLRQQGLVQDTVRGTTTSSARRETPSQVYGISTPGRKNPNGKPVKVGGQDSITKDIVDRLIGHSFVMDDGDINGDNQLIRLRSASGHQILLNDSAGVVYIANGTGNAWMEFSSNGSIDIYSGGAISMRSSGNMNFHSDGDINMFARNQIKMSSVSKMVLDALAIQQYADYDIQLQATAGSITAKAPNGSFVSYAGQQQIHMSSGQHHLTGSQVHFNSIQTLSDIVATIERTSVTDTSSSGTGTKRELIPDVITVDKYRAGPLTITENANVTMSGMRVPTHEPYPYHFDQVVSFVGGEPGPNDKIPGTPQFIAARNRLSDKDPIRFGQLGADLQYQLEKQGLGQVQTAANKLSGAVKNTTGSISAIQKAADDFIKNYPLTYGLPQNTLKSITPLTSGVNEIVNQTISAITGADKVGKLLSNQILVNKSGQLFVPGNFNSPLGTGVGTVKGVLDTISQNSPILSQTGIYSTIAGAGIGIAEAGYKIIKDPKGAAINYATSVVTNSFKNTIAGQVTANTAITSVLNNVGAGIKTAVASVTKAIGNIFKW
jgi:hypothetical protein